LDEALSGSHAKEWKDAAESEYQSLLENDTWDLVELPKGREAIGSKWVFKVKHDCSGKVERFKGRLVAKGYSQKCGIDFEETFAPVVRFQSVRTLLAFAVHKDEADSEVTIVAVSVDDLVVMSSLCRRLDAIKKALMKRFKMKDMELFITAVKRVLHYLSSTRDLTLHYQRSEESCMGYSDANGASRNFVSRLVWKLCETF
jgi:hypothetical protein